MRLGRIWLLLAVAAAWPVDARADILVAPFVGGTFAGRMTLPVFGLPPPEPIPLSKSLVFGAAGLWLTRGIFGAEGELAWSPGFVERADVGQAFVGSRLTSASGNIVVTMPSSITRDSLRPYLTGGLGLAHVVIEDRISIAGVDRNLLALNLGGGAIGMLSERTGLRFDLRHTRSVRDDQPPGGIFEPAQSRVRLSYWRATVGVVIRY